MPNGYTDHVNHFAINPETGHRHVYTEFDNRGPVAERISTKDVEKVLREDRYNRYAECVCGDVIDGIEDLSELDEETEPDPELYI